MYYKHLKDEYEKLDRHSFILQDRIYAYKKHLFDSNNPAKLQDRTSAEILFELQKFDKFLYIAYPSLKAITEIEAPHIDVYKRFCVEGLGNTYPTTNKKLRAIRKFFDFLRDINHIIKHNVALEVSYFDEDLENQPIHIPGSKLKLLMDIMYNYKHGVRDVCITKLIALMGIRIGETFELSYNL
jgi:site-specific recombinase XerD